MPNVLPFDKQVNVVSMLAEGASIRGIERMTGVHRDTVMRLGARVGERLRRFHGRSFAGIELPPHRS